MVTMELYVRSLPSRGADHGRSAVVDRLEELERAGGIEGFDVVVWGTEVAPETRVTETGQGELVLDRVDRFHEWARHNDRSVDPFFPRRTCEPTIAGGGEAREVIDLPPVALAEFEGEYLRHVTPHRGADGVVTPEDRLDALQGSLEGDTPGETTPERDGVGVVEDAVREASEPDGDDERPSR